MGGNKKKSPEAFGILFIIDEPFIVIRFPLSPGVHSRQFNNTGAASACLTTEPFSFVERLTSDYTEWNNTAGQRHILFFFKCPVNRHDNGRFRFSMEERARVIHPLIIISLKTNNTFFHSNKSCL